MKKSDVITLVEAFRVITQNLIDKLELLIKNRAFGPEERDTLEEVMYALKNARTGLAKAKDALVMKQLAE